MLTAVHTPGHTSDHVAFHVPAAGALFTGDAVLGRGTSFIDPPDGDLAQYLRSLARMRSSAPARSTRVTGRSCSTPPRSSRSTSTTGRARERQVVEAISHGPRTIERLVAEIYADYPPEVHALAARSVLAHLLKLEAEGRASHEGRGDDARWEGEAPRACERCGNPVKGRGRYCGSCSLILLQEGASGGS